MASPSTLQKWMAALPEEVRYFFARPVFNVGGDGRFRRNRQDDTTVIWSRVHAALISPLPGEPWKGDGNAS